jgi:hypothetical protein
MLLVNAVEERTNMTMLAESTCSKLLELRGGVHIFTFTQTDRSSPADRLASPDSIPHVTQAQTGRFDERHTVYVLPPPAVDVTALSASIAWSARSDIAASRYTKSPAGQKRRWVVALTTRARRETNLDVVESATGCFRI